MDIVLSNIEKDISKYINKFDYLDDKDLWSGRLKVFLEILYSKEKGINQKFFTNFRSFKKKIIFETPSVKYSYKNFWKFGVIAEKKYCYHQFNKMVNDNTINLIKENPLDKVGNPIYYKNKGIIFNERYLRHIHYLYLFNKYIKPELKNEKYNLIGIGSSYGQFEKNILLNYQNIKPILVDFPEQLFVAYYYLSKNFPEKKINTISSLSEINEIDQSFIDKYDIVLITTEKFNSLKVNKNIITNFNSFGEMSSENFNQYIKSDIFKNVDFFFTLNRLDSFPTYNNKISFLNYPLNHFKKKYLEISPLFDYHYTRENLKILKKPYHSRCFEFIGSKLNK